MDKAFTCTLQKYRSKQPNSFVVCTYNAAGTELDPIDFRKIFGVGIRVRDRRPAIFCSSSARHKGVVFKVKAGAATNDPSRERSWRWIPVGADEDLFIQTDANVLNHLGHCGITQKGLFTRHGSTFIHGDRDKGAGALRFGDPSAVGKEHQGLEKAARDFHLSDTLVLIDNSVYVKLLTCFQPIDLLCGFDALQTFLVLF